MSADPHPFSSASTAGRVIEAGKTYVTASGRELRVISADERLVIYRLGGEGPALRADRRTFLAAIRRNG